MQINNRITVVVRFLSIGHLVICDPQEMGREQNELAEYMNLKICKDTDRIQFWLDNSWSCQSCIQWPAKCYVSMCASIFSCQ